MSDKLIEVTLRIRVPGHCTIEELVKWLKQKHTQTWSDEHIAVSEFEIRKFEIKEEKEP